MQGKFQCSRPSKIANRKTSNNNSLEASRKCRNIKFRNVGGDSFINLCSEYIPGEEKLKKLLTVITCENKNVLEILKSLSNTSINQVHAHVFEKCFSILRRIAPCFAPSVKALIDELNRAAEGCIIESSGRTYANAFEELNTQERELLNEREVWISRSNEINEKVGNLRAIYKDAQSEKNKWTSTYNDLCSITTEMKDEIQNLELESNRTQKQVDHLKHELASNHRKILFFQDDKINEREASAKLISQLNQVVAEYNMVMEETNEREYSKRDELVSLTLYNEKLKELESCDAKLIEFELLEQSLTNSIFQKSEQLKEATEKLEVISEVLEKQESLPPLREREENRPLTPRPDWSKLFSELMPCVEIKVHMHPRYREVVSKSQRRKSNVAIQIVAENQAQNQKPAGSRRRRQDSVMEDNFTTGVVRKISDVLKDQSLAQKSKRQSVYETLQLQITNVSETLQQNKTRLEQMESLIDVHSAYFKKETETQNTQLASIARQPSQDTYDEMAARVKAVRQLKSDTLGLPTKSTSDLSSPTSPLSRAKTQLKFTMIRKASKMQPMISDKAKPVRFLYCMGVTDDIPAFLRHSGRVRHRDLSNDDIEIFVNALLQERLNHKEGFLCDFLFEYLQRKYAIQSVIAEWGYNLVHGLQRMQDQWSVAKILLLCIAEKICEDAFEIRHTIEKDLFFFLERVDCERAFRDQLQRSSRLLRSPSMKRSMATGVVSRSDVKTALNGFMTNAEGSKGLSMAIDEDFGQAEELDYLSFFKVKSSRVLHLLTIQQLDLIVKLNQAIVEDVEYLVDTKSKKASATIQKGYLPLKEVDTVIKKHNVDEDVLNRGYAALLKCEPDSIDWTQHILAVEFCHDFLFQTLLLPKAKLYDVEADISLHYSIAPLERQKTSSGLVGVAVSKRASIKFSKLSRGSTRSSFANFKK